MLCIGSRPYGHGPELSGCPFCLRIRGLDRFQILFRDFSNIFCPFLTRQSRNDIFRNLLPFRDLHHFRVADNNGCIRPQYTHIGIFPD